MNIGILGLLPDQVRFVQQEFPHHALRFLDKDQQSETKSFAKGCDKVVLMTKFIDHSISDRVPPSKRILLTGGVTKLKQTLSKLPTQVKDVTPPPITPTSPSQVVRVRKGKRVSVGLDEVDYSPLLTATVGDEVKIKRPPACDLAHFKKRLEVKRSHLKLRNGIRTSVPVMGDGFARVKILEIRTCETAAPNGESPPNSEGVAMHVENEGAISAPAMVLGGAVLADARAAAFWQSVFVETYKQMPGAPVDMIAARADEALQAYRSRVSVTALRAGMQ